MTIVFLVSVPSVKKKIQFFLKFLLELQSIVSSTKHANTILFLKYYLENNLLKI